MGISLISPVMRLYHGNPDGVQISGHVVIHKYTNRTDSIKMSFAMLRRGIKKQTLGLTFAIATELRNM